jgi:anti-sigma factor RsiW
MNSPADQEKSPVPYSPGHVPDWTLELLAEDALPPEAKAEAQVHVEQCALCAAELEGYRTLVAALSGLPRFEPSPGFADTVMARVNLQPRGASALARLRRWLPATRRGWMMLVVALLAPLAPLAAAVGWLLAQPLVTVGGLWSMSEKWVSEALWSLFSRALDVVVRSGAWEWGEAVVERAWELSTSELSLVLVVMAIATPLSAWALARLLKTPTGGIAHAH